MMQLTNRLNLPSPIVKAVESDPYTSGMSDISVTKLIAPPYQRRLIAQGNEEVDVADRIWALVGQIGHGILERIPVEEHVLREERLYVNCRDWVVSGQFDLIENGTLIDFKFTSVYAAKDGGKVEWEQQLNLLRLLALHKYDETGDERYNVQRLQIIAIFRDWSKGKTKQGGDYPQQQIGVIEIPVWSVAQAQSFMWERVRLHQQDNPEPCTDDERWAKPPTFALMKKNRKSAVKLYEIKAEADAALTEKADKDHYIEQRAGSFLRCESYCSVSNSCPHWQKQLADVPF